MVIKKTKLTGVWGPKAPVIMLTGYFCVLFPLFNIIFRESRWVAGLVYPGYFALGLFFLIGLKKIRLGDLGFSQENLKQNIIIGGVCGGALLLSLPLLDAFIDISGLGNSDLFAGAELRISNGVKGSFNLATIVASVLLLPILEQAFFSGFILQSLLNKFKPVPAVYMGAVIFTAAHFDFAFGGFAIGLITATFYHLTGTLYAGILFQMFCGLGGALILYIYPKLATLLAFLF